MNGKNNISAFCPKLRSDKQKTDLKAYNNKLNKFEKKIVDGLLKNFPDLQKKPKTGAERVSASREWMTQEQREKANTLSQERMEFHRIA